MTFLWYFLNALISCFSLVNSQFVFPLLCLVVQDLTNKFWNCLILMLILMLIFKWSLVWPNILPILIIFALRPTSGRLGSYSGKWWVWATCHIRAEQTKRWSSSSSSLSSLSSCPTSRGRNWTIKPRELARAQIHQSCPNSNHCPLGDATGYERRPPRATKLLPRTPLWSYVPGLLSPSLSLPSSSGLFKWFSNVCKFKSITILMFTVLAPHHE